MPRKPTEPERLLATVLFTDIVGSTTHAAEMGDRAWRRVISEHHAIVRRELKRFQGREIDTAGDGFFATFDQPARAIRCAEAVSDGVRRLGIEVRAGIHMGEVEVIGPKVGGIAVHIGARVMSKAGPSQILVSSTVRDLVAGSDLKFEDLGTHELKGVPGEWHLYAVERPPAPEEGPHEPEAERRDDRPGRRAPLVVALVAVAVAVAVLAAVLVARGGGGGLPPPAVDTVARIDASSGDIVGSIAVGRSPLAVAADGDTVWVANFADGTVQSIDTSTNEATPAVGLGISVAPNAIAVGGGFVWVVSGTTGTLYRIDPGQSHSIVPIELGDGLAGVAFGDGAVWVTNRNDDAVLRIDPGDPQAPPRSIALEANSAPAGIAFGGGAVWVAESLAGAVARIEPDSGEVGTVKLLAGSPDQVAFGGGFVWVTAPDDDSVTRITPARNALSTVQHVGNQPAGVAASDEGVWVATGLDGRVARIDPRSTKVMQRISLGGALSPGGVAVAGGGVWVAVHAP